MQDNAKAKRKQEPPKTSKNKCLPKIVSRRRDQSHQERERERERERVRVSESESESEGEGEGERERENQPSPNQNPNRQTSQTVITRRHTYHYPHLPLK